MQKTVRMIDKRYIQIFANHFLVYPGALYPKKRHVSQSWHAGIQ